ncbi:MAG: ribonuclease HII [Desulfurococcales archaeon]|nr:ribonuclease HII [Desulfurococcales archaeon]
MPGNCYQIGVDEAGRGSLIGEMIVGIAAVPCEIISFIGELGVRDSKELSPRSRMKLYYLLYREIPFVTVPVKPALIDSDNLGVITKKAILQGLQLLSKRINPLSVKAITIDRFGKERNIRSGIRKLGYKNAEIKIEEKADKKYPEVSLASIIAKHIRDKRITVINNLLNLSGSGYPSDGETMLSLAKKVSTNKLKELNGYIRLSWSTVEKLGLEQIKKKKSKTLEDYF